MPNWLPIICIEPKTATRSCVFMNQELSTLRTSPSRALNGALVNLAYMPGLTLRERLIEIADELGNDAEFARIAKVSRSAVSQWRKGDVKALKALSAVNIQERTGYSVRWLILGIGPKKLSGKPDLSTVSDIKRKLTPPYEHNLLVVLQSFLDTDDEGRDEITEAVRAITGNGASGRHHERKSRSKRR